MLQNRGRDGLEEMTMHRSGADPAHVQPKHLLRHVFHTLTAFEQHSSVYFTTYVKQSLARQ